MTRIDWPSILLTAVIAGAAIFQAILAAVIAGATIWQAIFAGRLSKLQQQIEDARKETAVYVAVELLESTSSRAPRDVRVRFENASPVGVLLSRLVIIARATDRTANPVNLDFRFSIRDYGSREAIITKQLFDAARSVQPANTAWQGGSDRHDVFLELTPRYEVAGKTHAGFPVRYRLEYSGPNLFQVVMLQPDDPGGKW